MNADLSIHIWLVALRITPTPQNWFTSIDTHSYIIAIFAGAVEKKSSTQHPIIFPWYVQDSRKACTLLLPRKLWQYCMKPFSCWAFYCKRNTSSHIISAAANISNLPYSILPLHSKQCLPCFVKQLVLLVIKTSFPDPTLNVPNIDSRPSSIISWLLKMWSFYSV